tara:strand:- start:119 stop:616 length:498 start_codon:yes stop_codon:yes gene_type:complete
MFASIEIYISNMYKQVVDHYDIVLLIKNNEIINKIFISELDENITNCDFLIYETYINDKLCHFFIEDIEKFHLNDLKFSVSPFISAEIGWKDVKVDLTSFNYFFIEDNEIYKKYQLAFYLKKFHNIEIEDDYRIVILDKDVQMKELNSSQYVLIKKQGDYEIKDL